MAIDTREIAEAVSKRSDFAASGREVLVALEMVELAEQELGKSREALKEAIKNFEQERILRFLTESARQQRGWCSLHGYLRPEGRYRDYYSCHHGELTDSTEPTTLIWVRKSCFHRGDHYGSDSEWTEEHVHAVCPDCLEAARDHIGDGNLAMVHRVEKRDDGYYHKNGDFWQKVADNAKYFLAPEKLKPEWEAELDIPPSLLER